MEKNRRVQKIEDFFGYKMKINIHLRQNKRGLAIKEE